MEARRIPLTPKNEPFRLDGRCTVVTGGGSGIGRAISEVFASNGSSVIILDVAIKDAEEAAALIRENGGKAEARACDISNHAETERVFQEILKDSTVDVLVNNAGIAHVGNIEQTTEDDFDRILRVNTKGVYNCLRAAIPSMKARRKGVILNMASIASSSGLPDRFAYSTSKGAVLAMTYSIARDYLAYGIRCNCISPARVYTPFVAGFIDRNYPGRQKEMMEQLSRAQPIGRMAEPREVALLALYLCSDAASFVTGVDYPLDGGFFNIR